MKFVRLMIMPVVAVCALVTAGRADDDAGVASTETIDLESLSDVEAASILRHDIEILDNELNACEKKRKGWVAATVIGGVGVVSTGVAAAVQTHQLRDNRKEKTRIEGEIQSKQGELDELEESIKEAKK